MDNFIRYLMRFFIIFGMPAYGVYLSRKIWKNVKSWTYYIHFKKGVTPPDLTTPVFQDYFTVEHVTEDGTVVVTSKVNDARLRKIISTESQLSLDAFHVTPHIIRMP